MTDDELLVLVQEKTPEELTAEEIGELRRRLVESEELRTALFETLQMEAYLAAALGPVQLRPEKIVAAADQLRDEGRQTWLWIGTTLGCLAFLALGWGVLRSAWLLSTPTMATRESKPEVAPPVADDAEGADGAAEKVVDPMPAATEALKTNPSPADSPASKAPPASPPVGSPPPVQPWAEVMATPADQLPAFADVCFNDFAYRSVLPRPEDLKQWFEALARP